MTSTELRFPTTEIAVSAREYVERIEPAVLANHSLRAYLFGTAIAAQRGWQAGEDYDDELLFLCCVLHDVGLTEEGDGDRRFEVDGADLAVRFVLERGLTEARAQVVWDAIALHTSPDIAERKGPEVALTQAGTITDVAGTGASLLPVGYADEVHARFPRLDVEDGLADAIVAQALAKPAKGAPMTLPGELVRQRVPSVHMSTWNDMVAASPWRK
ncbi:HD domain-containing protein [Actinosynnema sp. CS-041913]|uniref:HD domain-containing protein n=1 Tax=Actinosynnema sp. CS-041913 TaxID=3239917 RepID=UPI003D9241CE